jgi:hypothetical protein
MKTWHLVIPLLGMAAMASSFQKRERDASVASLQRAGAAVEGNGPSTQQTPTVISAGSPPSKKSVVSAVAMRDRYKEVFESESRDAAWADSAQRFVADRLKTTVAAGSTVESVECRASMCRIETVHSDRSSYDHFVRSAFMNPSTSLWNAPEFSTLSEGRSEGGPYHVVSYLAREGRTLPSLG